MRLKYCSSIVLFFERKYKGIHRINETLKDINGAILTDVAHCVIADSLVALHISQFLKKPSVE